VSKLPVLSWRDVLKILRRAGFWQTGQTGSHIFMTNGINKVTIPRDKEIKKERKKERNASFYNSPIRIE